jgi:hypothetical protein
MISQAAGSCRARKPRLTAPASPNTTTNYIDINVSLTSIVDKIAEINLEQSDHANLRIAREANAFSQLLFHQTSQLVASYQADSLMDISPTTSYSSPPPSDPQDHLGIQGTIKSSFASSSSFGIDIAFPAVEGFVAQVD